MSNPTFVMLSWGELWLSWGCANKWIFLLSSLTKARWQSFCVFIQIEANCNAKRPSSCTKDLNQFSRKLPVNLLCHEPKIFATRIQKPGLQRVKICFLGGGIMGFAAFCIETEGPSPPPIFNKQSADPSELQNPISMLVLTFPQKQWFGCILDHF